MSRTWKEDSTRKEWGRVSVGEEHPTPKCRLLLYITEYTTSASHLGKHFSASVPGEMLLTPWALLALPVALRVACLDAEPELATVFTSNADPQAGVDQTFIEDVCPDYTNYARVRQ